MERIDLTEKGVFGGIGDGTLNSNRQRSMLDSIMPSMVFRRTPLHPEHDADDLRYQHLQTLLRIFGDLNSNDILYEFNPYAKYMSGNYCDCCGVELNPLSRSRWLTICVPCDSRLDDNLTHRDNPLKDNFFQVGQNAEAFRVSIFDEILENGEPF